MPERQELLDSLRRDLKGIILQEDSLSKEKERHYLETFSERICEAAEAEAMTLYRKVESENIFHYIYYHPSLLHSVYSSPAMVTCLKEKLIGYRLPEGVGIVGEVIQTGRSLVFSKDVDRTRMLDLSEYTGFPVSSMITVPLGVREPFGAIQILNKNRYSNRFKFVEEDLTEIEPFADLLSLLLAKSWQILDAEPQMQDKVDKLLNPGRD